MLTPLPKSRWVKTTKQIVVELNFPPEHSGGIQVLFAHEHLHLQGVLGFKIITQKENCYMTRVDYFENKTMSTPLN
jgi:hypothetical protein